MADISKIKLSDGNTYDIKDAVARAATASSVTGVKGNSESSYRNGNVNLTPDNIGALAKNAEIQSTNPFAPTSMTGPYISKIDNALYAANKRWTVTATNVKTNQIPNLFDGSYETNMNINNGNTSVITIDFSSESTGYFPGYPYGNILVSFYYVCKPASISGRVYCNYSSQGIGWHDITFSPISDNDSDSIVYKASNSYYNISIIEITIVGDTTNSSGHTSVSQIEMHLSRPDSSRNPFLSKYGPETLYYKLTAPTFNGNLTGTVNGHTVNTDVPSNALFTDTTYDKMSSSDVVIGGLTSDDTGMVLTPKMLTNLLNDLRSEWAILPGDTVSLAAFGYGYTPTNSGYVYVFFPFSKKILASGATLTNISGFSIRGQNGLILSNVSDIDSAKISSIAISENGLRFMHAGLTTNWVANRPVTAVGTFTFSFN